MLNRLGRCVPTMRRNAVAGIALGATLLAGLGAAGCGSSSSTTTTTTTKPAALTKPQFLAQANAICARGNQALAPVVQALGAHPSPARITSYVTSTFAPSVQKQIDAIRALAAPESDQAALKTMLDIAQAELNRVRANPQLLGAGPSPFARFARLAHPYGLTACAAGQ